MLYGADYNPDQWPEEVWDDDVRLMQEAKVTTVSLGIFAWSRLQPAPDVWDFDWLDRVIDKLHAGGIGVNLATPTASPPPWVSSRHPDVLAADELGAPYWHGSRQHHSPSSPTYRRLAGEVVRRLAERYAHHPAVVMWHVSNELGCHLPVEYSDSARDAFRRWLADRYGDIAGLNAAWGTDFWSQRYGSFDEVFPPRRAPYTRNPAQQLDYRRFMSDMWLECYRMERDIIRASGATQPISTNMMGPFKPADYASWSDDIDVITDDCYPDPLDPHRVRNVAFQRDLVRSLKRETPWILLEQATDAVNWRPVNPSKQDGRLAAETAVAVGRGADGIMFFQWRQSRSGVEKFHSAMVPQAGTHIAGSPTRTWRDVTSIGAELAGLGALPSPAEGDAQVALVFDWENWWAVEEDAKPLRIDYLGVIREWYGALHARGVMVDIVPPEKVDARYSLAIAPFLYLLRDSGADALRAHVERGGTLLAGPFTDIVDECDRFRAGGFVTQLGPMLGIALEDFRALVPPVLGAAAERAGQEAQASATEGQHARVTGSGLDFGGTFLGEALVATGAEVLAAFEEGPSAGRPALTRNGSAWYVATQPDAAGVDAIVERLLAAAEVRPVVEGLPAGVEVARRGSLVTVVNHTDDAVDIAFGGIGTLPPQGHAFVREA
ncbi:beta-galactosidase [Microbacterium stercoris]|uniref:Beta-galactosidase n=1 Tax=Microbacterium stercoris TaxID=2820289 RepID=A0A939TLZ3_9MICO|nr:beta-galactosidase [Microbacterium stercoris]MBO3662638.1 beta-galactosidase [Microbacterium stercoris]